MKTKSVVLVVGTFSILGLISSSLLAANKISHKMLMRGRYLVRIGGCNDCHTPGYAESDGKVAESKWLEGNPVGFQGPWGTTYPSNLRLYMHKITLKEWMAVARKPLRPPMPWFNLHAMSDTDLRAIYVFIHHLGAAGKPAPQYVPPGKLTTSPYIDFVPKNLPQTARR